MDAKKIVIESIDRGISAADAFCHAYAGIKWPTGMPEPDPYRLAVDAAMRHLVHSLREAQAADRLVRLCNTPHRAHMTRLHRPV